MSFWPGLILTAACVFLSLLAADVRLDVPHLPSALAAIKGVDGTLTVE